MRASRAPWWLYFIAASFVGYFTFQIYVYIWGPESLGFDSDHSSGSLLVQKVTPEGAGARAGLRAGDRIVAVGSIAVRTKKSRYDFFRSAANFEPGRPILIEVERQGKTVELTVNFGRRSLRGRDWLDWEILAASMFTFILALMIGVRRPYDPVARITAWFMASMAFDMSSFPSGWASVWRHLPSALGLCYGRGC